MDDTNRTRDGAVAGRTLTNRRSECPRRGIMTEPNKAQKNTCPTFTRLGSGGRNLPSISPPTDSVRRTHGTGWSAICLSLGFLVIPGCMTAIGGPATTSRNAKGPSLLSSSDSASSKTPASIDGLRVGNELITPAALWRFDRVRLIETAETMDPAAFRGHVEKEAARLVRDTTTENLLYQSAAERITPQMETGIAGYVDADIRKIVTAQFGGVQRRYERDLHTKGLTLEEVREKMRRDVVITSYLDAEIKPRIVEPSRGDLLDAYTAFARENQRPPRRRMSLIDARVKNELPHDVVDPTHAQLADARVAARTRIESALGEWHDGVSFGDVARRHSDGLHAGEGGSWGWVRRGAVRERFEPAVEALFALDENAVSHAIETSDGFFLVRCDEIDDGGTPDFVAVQPELKNRFHRNMFNDLVSTLVEKLRREARLDPEDLDRFWQAAVREGLRIVREAREGPPTP